MFALGVDMTDPSLPPKVEESQGRRSLALVQKGGEEKNRSRFYDNTRVKQKSGRLPYDYPTEHRWGG